MKWKNVKFWCWIEVSFPTTPAPTSFVDTLFDPLPAVEEFTPAIDDPEALEMLFGAGAQGPQGPQCGGPPNGQIFCFDLLSYNAEFELNGIPTCTVNAAIGRRADDVSLAATIHYHVDDMKLQLPAVVWCLAKSVQSSEGHDAVAQDWPAGKFKIFDGYITGTGFRRNTNGAELPLMLTHWLADLNFSSAVTKQSHPLNAAQYNFPANFTLFNELSAGGLITTGPFMVSSEMAGPYFFVSTLLNDFWGGDDITNPSTHRKVTNGLKAWLLAVTRAARLNALQISNLAGAGTSELRPADNWEACRALNRFEPNAIHSGTQDTGYVLGTALAMFDFGDLNYFIYQGITDEIGKESMEVYENVTLWDKLAGQLHSNYMYSVVPLVDKALVVPFIAGLSTGDSDLMVQRILSTADYESIDLQAVIPRPLRAVGVIMEEKMVAGGGNDKGPPAQYPSFGGWFDKMTPPSDIALNPGGSGTPDPRYKEGLIMFKAGPKWLSNMIPSWEYSDRSTGAATGANIQTSVSPNAGVPRNINAPRTVIHDAQPVWDLYARSLYITEILKNRQGTVTGPVRFDIAPGSTIKIEAAQDKFVKHVIYGDLAHDQECLEQYYKFYWASVLRVSINIDCQNMRGFTNYYIAHFRDRNENKDVATAIGRHPLWQGYRWAGCVLVQDDAFTPWTASDPVVP